MTNKEKRQRRSQKKFDKLAADFKHATPHAGPARSPVVGPVRLNRVQEPFEELPGAVLCRIAAFAGPPKDVQRTLSAVSRSAFVAIETVRHRTDSAGDLDAVARAVAAKRAALAAPGSPASPVDASGDVTLAAIAASGDRDLVGRVAFALLRLGRSVLYNVRRQEAPAAATEWVVAAVANGHLPLASHDAASGRTLLHMACAMGDQLLAQKLLNAASASPHGFDAFAVDVRRRTALHIAAAEGLADTCTRIIHLADPAKADHLGTVTDDRKRTVVDAATQARHSKLAASLRAALQALAAAADDDDEDDFGASDFDGEDY